MARIIKRPYWVVSWTRNIEGVEEDYWIRVDNVEDAYLAYASTLEMDDLVTSALSLQVESTD